MDLRGGQDGTSLVTEHVRTSTGLSEAILFHLSLRSILGVFGRAPRGAKLFRRDSHTATLSFLDIPITLLLSGRLRHLHFHTH